MRDIDLFRLRAARKSAYAKTRRSSLKAAGLCINGAGHGKATHGVRCERCYKTHGETATWKNN